VDEMSADEQLGLPVRQFANRVRRPYFLKECFSHLTVTEQPFALEGKVLRKDSTDHKVSGAASPSRSHLGSLLRRRGDDVENWRWALVEGLTGSSHYRF
jgi:hypothetical protein